MGVVGAPKRRPQRAGRRAAPQGDGQRARLGLGVVRSAGCGRGARREGLERRNTTARDEEGAVALREHMCGTTAPPGETVRSSSGGEASAAVRGRDEGVPQTHCSLVEIFCCHQHCAHELCSMSAAKMAARCGVELRRWKERVTAPGARCWSAHVEPAQAPNGCELSENGRDDLCFNEIGDAGATQLATRCAPPPAWSSCTPAATSSAMRARRSSPTRCAPIPARRC